tara:strand:- start:9196 stop:9732 length:537 start_codon:yes stop_codon:yes gene_type:complete
VHTIKQLLPEDFDEFFIYLNKQLSHNGRDGSPLFMPMSRSQSHFPKEKQQSFVDGLNIPVGAPRWRRAWFIVEDSKQICGHVDLRALHEPCTQHRSLLGLGVLKESQGKGFGALLTRYAMNWAKSNDLIEIIDLAVLSSNLPAIRLYEKLGFERICEIHDMFRVDGQSESHIMMSKIL